MKTSYVLLIIIANIQLITPQYTVPTCSIAPGCTTPNYYNSFYLSGIQYCTCSWCVTGRVLDFPSYGCCTTPTTLNCYTCMGSSTGDCSQCFSGYAFQGADCLSCSTNIANCQSCNTIHSCSSCASSYFVVPNGTYCDLCSLYLTDCLYCSSNTTCTQCTTGFGLSGTICQPCNIIPNCATCYYTTTCSSCINSSYAISGSNCDLCSNLMSGCVTCASNNVCISCLNSSLTLNSTGACVTCSSLLNGCDTCSNNYLCSTCLPGFIQSGSNCQTCTALIPNCITCTSSSNCLTCTAPTYIPSNGSCVFCSVVLTNCTQCVSNTICTKCTTSTTLALLNGKCQMCQDVLAWCINCASNTTCNQCNPAAYMMPSSTCMWCAFKISYCDRCFYNSTPATGMTCTRCDANHVLDVSGSGYCYSCQSLMTACHACYSSPTLCYACLNDTLAVNTTATPNTCIPCSSTLIYCVRCLNVNECIKCVVDPNIYIDVQNTYTDALIPGGSYSITNFTGASGVCKFCNVTYPLCSVCNSTQCLVCYATKNITLTSVGTCRYCRNLISGCELCYSETECTECKNSMLALVTISPTVRICKLCCDIIYGCLTCSSPKVCTRCSIGVIVNGSCSSVAGCALVGQTGNSPSRCLKCMSPEFYPQVVLQSCICQKGHIAGCCCTQITGCTAIQRTATQDICTSCNANLNFDNIDGKCVCKTNYFLVGDHCEENCGDGIMFDQQCDDGNKQDFDGCSSLCKVQENYECRGGSSTTASTCQIKTKISLVVTETRKQPGKNRLTVVISIYPPTRLLQLIDFTTKFHFTPVDQLTLVQIDVTHNFITIGFDYLQDLPEILATMWLELDTVHFIQDRLQTSYLLQTTSGEPLFYDPWAGGDYSGIKNTLIYLSITALIVSVLSTATYKMIGVQTIHTFQLMFFGMVFSRRYSNYFHNFDQLVFTEGQSSSLFSEQKMFVSYRLAFMRYCDLFEANIVIVASTVFFTFCVWSFIGMLKKIWEDRMDKFEGQKVRIIARQKDKMGKIRRIIYDNILFPLSLSFFYHFIISCICQSYQSALHDYSLEIQILRAIAKMILSCIILYVLFEEFTKAFIKLLTQNIKGNYRKIVIQKPLEPHQPTYKYVAFYIAGTFGQGLLTLPYLFFDMPYYIEVNLLVSLVRMIVLLVTRPYQMAIHNWAISYNALVLVIGFTWFLLEQFYLLSPSITKIFAYILLGCLSGVLAMATVRSGYNIWFKYKEKTLQNPIVQAGNDQNKERNSKQQKLLGTKRGNYLNRRRRQMISSEQKDEQLQNLIKQYKMNFSKSIKMPIQINQSRRKL